MTLIIGRYTQASRECCESWWRQLAAVLMHEKFPAVPETCHAGQTSVRCGPEPVALERSHAIPTQVSLSPASTPGLPVPAHAQPSMTHHHSVMIVPLKYWMTWSVYLNCTVWTWQSSMLHQVFWCTFSIGKWYTFLTFFLCYSNRCGDLPQLRDSLPHHLYLPRCVWGHPWRLLRQPDHLEQGWASPSLFVRQSTLRSRVCE